MFEKNCVVKNLTLPKKRSALRLLLFGRLFLKFWNFMHDKSFFTYLGALGDTNNVVQGRGFESCGIMLYHSNSRETGDGAQQTGWPTGHIRLNSNETSDTKAWWASLFGNIVMDTVT